MGRLTTLPTRLLAQLRPGTFAETGSLVHVVTCTAGAVICTLANVFSQRSTAPSAFCLVAEAKFAPLIDRVHGSRRYCRYVLGCGDY